MFPLSGGPRLCIDAQYARRALQPTSMNCGVHAWETLNQIAEVYAGSVLTVAFKAAWGGLRMSEVTRYVMDRL